MSYEGYVEFLCVHGHHTACDCMAVEPKECRFCKAQIEFRHAVDETNGICLDQPWTMAAPMQLVGFDDEWHVDHHGNRYATKVDRWKPTSPEWKRILVP